MTARDLFSAAQALNRTSPLSPRGDESPRLILAGFGCALWAVMRGPSLGPTGSVALDLGDVLCVAFLGVLAKCLYLGHESAFLDVAITLRQAAFHGGPPWT